MAQDMDDDGTTPDLPEQDSPEEFPDFLRTEPIPVLDPADGGRPAVESEPSAPAAVPASAPALMKKKSSRGKRVGITTAAIALLLGGAYVGAAWHFADHVPAGTTVSGVDISGMTRDDAIGTLDEGLAHAIAADIEVVLGEAEAAIEPESAGLAIDIPATVDELLGFTLDPVSLYNHIFGHGEHDPVLTPDREALTVALETIAVGLDVDPVEGTFTLVGGEVEETAPEDGYAVDIPAAVDFVIDQWLAPTRPVELPHDVVSPEMDVKEMSQVRESVLDPLFSGDIELSVNEYSAAVPNSAIVEAASLHRTGATYEVKLDEEMIGTVVKDLFPELGESPVDARFEFRDGKPHIVPAVNGAGINPDTLAEELARAAVRTGEERSSSIELETTEPEFTTKDAEELGIDERVVHFTTPVPYDPVRTENLLNGSKKLNGMLIRPGETFSLIEAFGPITRENGYVESGVIINGFSDVAMGGGLSQISTTMFNAAYEAGMEDVAHQPHSRHFDRYPEGREATIFLPYLDLQWRNNTPYGVLIQAWVDDNTNIALWSTKYWDTKITTGPRTHLTAPTTVYNTASNCIAESGGKHGFTVYIDRVVSRDGVRNEEYSGGYSHTYDPWNTVICGEKPKPKPESKTKKD